MLQIFLFNIDDFNNSVFTYIISKKYSHPACHVLSKNSQSFKQCYISTFATMTFFRRFTTAQPKRKSTSVLFKDYFKYFTTYLL